MHNTFPKDFKHSIVSNFKLQCFRNISSYVLTYTFFAPTLSKVKLAEIYNYDSTIHSFYFSIQNLPCNWKLLAWKSYHCTRQPIVRERHEGEEGEISGVSLAHNSRVTILRHIYGPRDPHIMRVSTIYQSYSTPDNNFIRGLRLRWGQAGVRRDTRMSAPFSWKRKG